LKRFIDKLKENDIKFLLSNSCCDFIKELYSGYNIKEIPLRRLIGASGDSRNIVKEVLIY
jgi:DNA adenine methylase